MYQHTIQLSPAGFEPTTYGLKVPERGDLYSISDEAHETDSGLAQIVASWPSFSQAKRSALLAIVAASID